MDIIVLNDSFERIAVVDYYESLMWCKRYYDIGALDLQIEATTETLSIFKRGNFIIRDDDDAIFRIEAVELDTRVDEGNFLIVGAYDCKKILTQRIVWTLKTFKSGTAEQHLRALITDCIINPTSSPDASIYPPAKRKISNFRLKPERAFSSETVIEQITYDNLAEKITEVCKSYGWGWKVTFESGLFYFDIYKGENKSQAANSPKPVIFSPDFENLSQSKYTVDSSEYKNAVLIGGEGEGVEKKLRMLGENIEGIDRYEMFVDADSISSNSEDAQMSIIEYYEALRAKGYEELAKTETTTSFEGDVDVSSYEYKTDYNLGDIVTLQNEYGIGANARIVEITETWDSEGYTVTPVFDELGINGEPLHAPSISVYDLIDGKQIKFDSVDRGVEYHYTTDGTTPTADSPTGRVVDINSVGVFTIQVITERDGMFSAVQQRIVTLEKVSTVTISVQDIMGGKNVSWDSQTKNVQYYYTLNDSTPTPQSSSGTYYQCKTAGTFNFKVKGYRWGFVPSDIVSASTTVGYLSAPTVENLHPEILPGTYKITYPENAEYKYYKHWNPLEETSIATQKTIEVRSFGIEAWCVGYGFAESIHVTG